MLTEKLTDYVNAAFTGIYVQSAEPDEAQTEILRRAKSKKWNVATWDCSRGLCVGTKTDDNPDPTGAVKALPAMAQRDEDGNYVPCLLLMHNLNRFWQTPDLMQACVNQLVAGKANKTFIVVLSPTVDVPTELTKLFVIIEHELPNREQLQGIAEELLSGEDLPVPTGDEMAKVVSAAAGLTRLEAENAMSLSLVKHNKLLPEVLWEIKAQTLKKSGLCELYRGEPKSFEDLRGVDHIRHLSKQLLREDCPIPPKGFIFMGAPGVGKTSCAKAIATDNGLPLVMGDLPSLKDKFVGGSEQKVRRFIQLAEAMAPCVLLLDEIEDALAGATGEHVGDSGVSRDQLSAILKWRTESRAKVFIVGTCNEPQSLLKVKQGALVRDGRFDGIVFFDLPDKEAKTKIWDLYKGRFKIKDNNPKDDGWAPSNIEVCCQRAVQYGISLVEAAKYVRPTPTEDIAKLRSWANGRCLSATKPGIYTEDVDLEQLVREPVKRRITRGGDA